MNSIIPLKLLLFYTFFTFAAAQRTERKCFSRSEPKGKYQDLVYEVIFATEGHKLQLECQACDEVAPVDSKAIWTNVRFNRSARCPIYKDISKKCTGKYNVLENNTLHLDKVMFQDEAVYSCNTTRRNDTTNSTITVSYNYLVQVIGSDYDLKVPSGTSYDWKLYETEILNPVAARLEEESLDDQVASLGVFWTNWTDCLCPTSSHTLDAKKFRMAYPYIRIYENERTAPIYPFQSDWLKHFYPYFWNIVRKVKAYRLYENCATDCLPSILEQDQQYKYVQSVYLAEGSNSKFSCPDSENGSEILWVLNEETLLPKNTNSLGTGDSENRVAIDLLDELLLVNVRSTEAGTYSCIVDAMPIKKITVVIIPRSIFLSKDFLQCILTIAYVLVFSFVVCIFILCAKIYQIYALHKQ